MNFDPDQAPDSAQPEKLLCFGKSGNVSPEMQEFFDRNAGNAFDRCIWVSNFLIAALGNQFRNLIDVQKGMLRFAESPDPSAKHIDRKCNLIGEVYQGGLFIWAWAHEALGMGPFPGDFQFSNQLRLQLGKERGIEEFATPFLKFRNQVDLDAFYLSIQGWANSDSYFNFVFGEISIVAFVAEHSFERKIQDPSRRVRQFFPELLARCPVSSQRLTFECYIESLGFNVLRNGLISSGSSGAFSIEAKFDQADQLVEISK